jgi:hypothetical protein
VFGCTSTTSTYKRSGDSVTIHFQAITVNSEDSSMRVMNQILSDNDTQILTVLYRNGENTLLYNCTTCTFTGNVATGDLSIRIDNIKTSDRGTYKHSVTQTRQEVKGCAKVYILGKIK